MSLRYTNAQENAPAVSYGYTAVPLDLDPTSRRTYRDESLRRIRSGLAAAMKNAYEIGWAEPGDLADSLERLVDESLTESHEKRLFLHLNYPHDNQPLGGLVDANDERVALARQGVATPEALLSLLRDFPALRSIELAKLSHPLDATATWPMDWDVRQTVKSLGGVYESEDARYKAKTRLLAIPAMTVLRKQVVGRLDGEGGEIDVVSRQAFLVRGDSMAREFDPFIDRKIKNTERFSELEQKIRGYYEHLDENPNLRWLQPIATSYYAKYLNPEDEVKG